MTFSNVLKPVLTSIEILYRLLKVVRNRNLFVRYLNLLMLSKLRIERCLLKEGINYETQPKK